MQLVIIQSIGYLALLSVVLSFQKNKRKSILFYMFLGIILFVIHYSLLNAWTGAIMNLIEGCMVYVAYNKRYKKWARKPYWLFLFIIVFLSAGVLTAKSFVDFLPAIAQVIGAVAVWQRQPKTIRILMLFPRPLWFIYNLSVGSQDGMLTEVLILLSVVIGIVRFDIKKNLLTNIRTALSLDIELNSRILEIYLLSVFLI